MQSTNMIKYVLFLQSDLNPLTEKIHFLSGISLKSSVCIEVLGKTSGLCYKYTENSTGERKWEKEITACVP